jgi:hypothetical protein
MDNKQFSDNTNILNQETELDNFIEKNIFKTLRIFFIYQYLLMLMIVIVVFLLCRK